MIVCAACRRVKNSVPRHLTRRVCARALPSLPTPALQILKMENLVLKVLQFDMGAVTAHSFAERFLKAAAADEKTKFLAQYLMELTLQDGERYLKYRPSVVAAASICVALHTLALPHWVRQRLSARTACVLNRRQPSGWVQAVCAVLWGCFSPLCLMLCVLFPNRRAQRCSTTQN